MHSVDDWHDWWRVLLFSFCLASIIVLHFRFRRNRATFNKKTMDYWVSFVMWNVAGCVFAIEGVLRNRPLGATLVFMSFAAVICARGLIRKGSWGVDQDLPRTESDRNV